MALEPGMAGSWSLVFSPENDRVLVVTPASLALYALDTGERLAHVASPPGVGFGTAVFDGARTIRAVRSRAGVLPLRPRDLEIVTVALPEVTVQVTGRIESPGSRSVRFDPSLRRLMVMGEKDRPVVLFDGRSGERVADLAPKPDAFAFDAGFLSDGRVALAEALSSGVQVRLFDPDGREQAVVPLGRARSVRLGGEPLPGWLAVGLEAAPFGPTDLALLDTRAARVVRVEKGLGPPHTFWNERDGVQRRNAGSPGASLFMDENAALVRLDPESGERRIILPGAPHGGRYP
jgi:hypothetical protein